MNASDDLIVKSMPLPGRGPLSWGVWLLSLFFCVYLTWQLHHLQIESVKFVSLRLYYLMEAICFGGSFVAFALFTSMTLWLDKKFRPYPVYSICLWMIVMLVFTAIGQRFKSPDMLDETAMYFKILTHPSDLNQNHLHLLADGHTVEISGIFHYGITPALAVLLDKHPEITTVRFESPGGVAAEGIWLGKLIRQRGLDTKTENYCISSCTFAFMGGVQRYAAPAASFGFHRPSILATHQEYEKIVTYMRSYLMQSGARPAFVEQAMAHKFRAPWYPDHEQLADGNVLTQMTE